MRRIVLITLVGIACMGGKAQVAEMNWELDYQVYLKLANDSNYVFDVREAFHVTEANKYSSSDFVFYPVTPSGSYGQDIDSTKFATEYSTLWSALHAKIGGGWIHFTNCIAYAIEVGQLNLYAPLMKRPQTDWKPKPMTDSYKRTRKWEYYVPMSQKNAVKEYKQRNSEGNLGDLKSLPESYIELFLNTSQKQYDNYVKEGKVNFVARIDLVKVILGANYLSEAQITLISNAVFESIKNYTTTRLPSVIVFDEYQAAAAMSLSAEGYVVEDVVFQGLAKLRDDEVIQRTEIIHQIVDDINEYNRNSFQKRLDSYYNE